MGQATDVESKDPTPTEIRDKIIHILTLYPVISPTMLQNGIGPWVRAGLWRPVLDALIDEGVVIRTQESVITPQERYNTYTKLSLATLDHVVFKDE